jgi:hypothetical protein
MITKMKKLISISTIPVLALALLLVLGTVLSGGAAQANKTTPPLTCATEYWWMPGWVGPVSGDIDGVIKWTLLSKSPHPAPPGQVGQMLFRWEIWDVDEEVLLLAGDENERTIVRHGKNSVWRANGIVTEASEEFEDYIGSQMHDGGNFTWASPGVPEHGFGTLRIAGSAEGSK